MFKLSGDEEKEGDLAAIKRLLKKLNMDEMAEEEGSKDEEASESENEEAAEQEDSGSGDSMAEDSGSDDESSDDSKEEESESFEDFLRPKSKGMPEPRKKVMELSVMAEKSMPKKGRKKGSKGKY